MRRRTNNTYERELRKKLDAVAADERMRLWDSAVRQLEELAEEMAKEKPAVAGKTRDRR